MEKDTNIPVMVLSELFEYYDHGIITIDVFNVVERTHYATKLHGNSKRIYPFWKWCSVCGSPYRCFTKEQALRMKTCSSKCKNISISNKKTGVTIPIEERNGRFIVCSVCGITVWKPNAWLKRIHTPSCSYECNGKMRARELIHHAHKGHSGWSVDSKKKLVLRMIGENNPSWSGGVTYRNRHGRYRTQKIKHVRCPSDFSSMARKDGYILEHRLNAAIGIGRCISTNEVVHHIDHDATNNKIENLMIFQGNAEHKMFEGGSNISPIWCGINHVSDPHKCSQCHIVNNGCSILNIGLEGFFE